MVGRRLMFVEAANSTDRRGGRVEILDDLRLVGDYSLDPFACLSSREREIAGLVASGSSNKEIARDLEISPNTVSSHLRQIFARLGIVRRAELCRLWYRAELLRRGKSEPSRVI